MSKTRGVFPIASTKLLYTAGTNLEPLTPFVGAEEGVVVVMLAVGAMLSVKLMKILNGLDSVWYLVDTKNKWILCGVGRMIGESGLFGAEKGYNHLSATEIHSFVGMSCISATIL